MAETLRKKVDEPIVSPAGLIHGYDNLARYIGLPAISVKKAKGFGIPRIPDFSYGTVQKKAPPENRSLRPAQVPARRRALRRSW
jgi:hypothetical protein